MGIAIKTVKTFGERKRIKRELITTKVNFKIVNLDFDECWLFVISDHEDFIKHHVHFDKFTEIKESE